MDPTPRVEKRPPPDAEPVASPVKKPRCDADLRRVAEIVLALSTLAKIRGGEKPTEPEIGLMEEARAKLVELCEGLPPKEIVARDAIAAVIENLGINASLKEQQGLGFRGPKLTVAEKFALTKRKMDESKKYATHPSQPLKISFNAAAESHGMPHTVRMSTDNPNHAPMATGGYVASPLVHVSTVTPTSAQYQLSVGSGSVPGRDSSSPALPRGERVQLRTDGGANGSFAYQVQANSSANHPLVNASTWSTQTLSGPENKVLNHTSVRVEGTAGMGKPPMTSSAKDQNSRSFASQPSSGHVPGGHQPSQKIRFIQTSSLPTNHNEIAKIIQKILQPQLPDHPTWIPPSRDYMSKALTCQTCQVSINEVDNVLICDACEKGYHIACAQSPNQRGIPRGEWHCARCLSLSNGKPLPPKYGRVMRSNIQLKAPSSTVASSTVSSSMVPSSMVPSSTVPSSMAVAQMSSGNKVGDLDPKIYEQKVNAHVTSVSQNPAHGVGMSTNSVKSETDPEVPFARETREYNVPSSSVNTDEKPVSERILSSETSSKQISIPELSASDRRPSDLSNKDADPNISAASETDGNKLPLSSNHMDETTLSGSFLSDESTSQQIYISDSSKSDKRPFEPSAESPADLCYKDSDPNISSVTEAPGNNFPPSSQDTDEKPLSGCFMSDENSTQDTSESSRLFESSAEPSADLSNKDADPSILSEREMQGVPICKEDPSCSISNDQDNVQENTCESLVLSSGTLEHSGVTSDGLRPVEWIGDPIQIVSEKHFYRSCRIDGVTYELQEHALLQSSHGILIPSKLQSLWEDMKTGSKWVIVNSCYFPTDIPETVHAPTPESNEVYESNHESTVMAGFIIGPCKVLPLAEFNKEIERRSQLGDESNNELRPVFMCKWNYDESKGFLQPVSQ